MVSRFPCFSPTYLLKILATYPPISTIWVAYSGGLDSQVLLHALAQLQPQRWRLQAVHVHHHLQPQADSWVHHCQRSCERLAIPCRILSITIPLIKGESIEAQARETRYTALARCLQPNDLLVTAHHADDQVETVLLQLLRGAGVAGLAAISPLVPFDKGWLGRPLLAFSRTQLFNYAQAENLQWSEDPSNLDRRFDRNFLRHEIIPKLHQRWPNVSQVFNRVAQHQAEAQTLLQTLADQDFQSASVAQQLSISALKRLTVMRQRNLLRYWLKQRGLPMPSTQQLQRILEEVIPAGQDRQPLVRWQGGEVHRHKDQLFAIPNLPVQPKKQLYWTLPEACPLPVGILTAAPVRGKGLAIASGTVLQIRFRRGGEYCIWRGHRRIVKKLLQSADIPAWQRPFIPFIYDKQEQLLAIPNIAICDQATVQTQAFGWDLRWVI